MTSRQMMVAILGFLLVGLSLHEYWKPQLDTLL